MTYARVDTLSAGALATAFFGESRHHCIDVFVGTGTAPASGLPVMLYVHGGGWNKGKKEQFQSDQMFIGSGTPGFPAGFGIEIDELAFPIAACSTNYRMNTYSSVGPDSSADGEPMGLPVYAPDNVIDTMMAVQWLIDNASTYNLDPNKIILYGDSAGAVNACVGAYGVPMPFGLNEMPHEMARYKFNSPQAVLGVVNSRGIGDATVQSDSLFTNLFGAETMAQLTQSRLRAASPKHLIDAYGKNIPMVMIYDDVPDDTGSVTIHDPDNATPLIASLTAKGIAYSTHYDTVTGSNTLSKSAAWDDCKEIWNGTFTENT